jgi:hypothetical protein
MEVINSALRPVHLHASRRAKWYPGRSAFGATTDDCSYSNHVYVCGGITSGRGDGFLKMRVEPTPASVRLQGTQTSAVNIYIEDENGDSPETVKVRVQGFLGAGGDGDIDNIYSPSIIRTDEIIVHNGKGVATLLPRSDDITPSDGGRVEMSEGSLRSYTVSVRATIIDSFYEGRKRDHVHHFPGRYDEGGTNLRAGPPSRLTSGSRRTPETTGLPRCINSHRRAAQLSAAASDRLISRQRLYRRAKAPASRTTAISIGSRG